MLSEHFSQDEFKCTCCGEIKYDPLLFAKLECLRASLNHIPIIVNSGYRCQKNNKKVGGVDNSLHLQGKAIDIRTNGNMAELVKMADRIFKNNGLGIYKNFIHVDTGKRNRFHGKY